MCVCETFWLLFSIDLCHYCYCSVNCPCPWTFSVHTWFTIVPYFLLTASVIIPLKRMEQKKLLMHWNIQQDLKVFNILSELLKLIDNNYANLCMCTRSELALLAPSLHPFVNSILAVTAWSQCKIFIFTCIIYMQIVAHACTCTYYVLFVHVAKVINRPRKLLVYSLLF